MTDPPIFGLIAEFEEPAALTRAAARAYESGYRRMDAHSPFPIEGLADVLGFRRTRLPLIVLVAGLLGCITGFLLQYYIAVVDYPINVGGRPLNSWPSFVIVSFELTILFAAFGAVFGMLGLNKLPMPYHPVFNVERFALATRDRFFLCIEGTDPRFDRTETETFLRSLNPIGVYEVEP